MAMAAGAHTIGIIMNGVTGRMGTNQHLVRSILAIRREGGVRVGRDVTIVPDPILVGRNEEKLRNLARQHGVQRYSTDLDACLSDAHNQIYFDAQTTELRAAGVLKAIKAKKAVYCEKPLASTFADSLMLYREARAAGVKNGIVQDKLWLPGVLKLRRLVESGFFGKILAVRGEFGYWVFDGISQPCQRPSWNYRKEDGGGIISDMFCHWRYLIDNLFGNITSVSCLGTTQVGLRKDEAGEAYTCTAEDGAYTTFECENGVLCQFNSSWATRVRRDDLLTLQVDGVDGSAVAGLQRCYVQQATKTPRLVWNPDVEAPADFHADWEEVDAGRRYENAFKIQWQLFLRHVAHDEEFRWTFLEGVKGLQLAELAVQSWTARRWMSVPPLDL